MDNDLECQHDDVITENGYNVCTDCGVVLTRNYNQGQHLINSRNIRKIVFNAVYNEIPSYIDSEIKDLTIELYKLVTNEKIFRNIFRKSIILACLYRASILLKQPINFHQLLEFFGIKNSAANKGIIFTSIRLPLDSYKIPFCTEIIDIEEITSLFDLKNDVQSVLNIIKLLTENSDLINNSHSKSIICGCVWFILQQRNSSLTLKQFCFRCDMAETTVQKKFLRIKLILTRIVMKKIFVHLLRCDPTIKSLTDYSKIERNCLFNPDERIIVKNYTSQENVAIVSSFDDFIYPIDDVDDVKEWNFLFQKHYWSRDGKCFVIKERLVETKKDLYLVDENAKKTRLINTFIAELIK